MTQEELEILVLLLKDQLSGLSSAVISLLNSVATILTSIGLVNKLSKLLDTNITDLNKNDLLQFDGDRWTNITPSKVITSGGGSGGSSTLEGLDDVYISGKSDKQALCWNNALSKWTNTTIQGGGDSGDMNVTAMWQELKKNDRTNTIHPSHIAGDLNIGSITSTGDVSLTSNDVKFNLNTLGVTVIGNTNIEGNLLSTGEITAYA